MRVTEHGVVLDISVSPNAKRTEVVGLHDSALRIRLAAQPVDGQANAALLRWLADELGIARQQVELLRGDSARRKQVQIRNATDKAQAWLADKLQAETKPPTE